MADRLLAFCRFLKNRSRGDWDNVILIDGQEGTGKSTLGAWLKAGYDDRLNLDYVIYDGMDLMDTIESAPDGVSIWVDEGKDVANRRRWYSDMNIALGESLSIMRDKNFLLILNIPRWKELDGHVIDRFHYRFWTYTPNKMDRGYCNVYEFIDGPFPKKSRWQRLLFHYRFPKLPDWYYDQYHKNKRKNLEKKLKEYAERAKGEKEKQRKKSKRELGFAIIDKKPDITPKDLANDLDVTLTYAREIINTKK